MLVLIMIIIGFHPLYQACGELFHWECVGWNEFNIGLFWCQRCKDCHYFAEDDEMPRTSAATNTPLGRSTLGRSTGWLVLHVGLFIHRSLHGGRFMQGLSRFFFNADVRSHLYSHWFIMYDDIILLSGTIAKKLGLDPKEFTRINKVRRERGERYAIAAIYRNTWKLLLETCGCYF